MRSADPADYKKQYDREPLASRFVMSPIRGLNKGFGHLSGFGFKTIIAPVFAFGAMAVGVETAYKALPDMSWSLPRDERAFIPKIGFEDGAEIGRLVPLKTVVFAPIRAIAPEPLQRFVPTSNLRTVWLDPQFWFAVAATAAVQYQERKLFQRKSYAQVRKEAMEANATTKLEVKETALDIARAKVRRHNAYGMGAETMSGATVIMLYGAELLSCAFGMRGATSWVAVVGWSLYSIFGFEIFYSRDDAEANQDKAQTQQTAKAQTQQTGRA
jgi:hypothetical protein